LTGDYLKGNKQINQTIILVLNIIVIMIIYLPLMQQLLPALIIYATITVITTKLIEKDTINNKDSPLTGITYRELLLIWNLETPIIIIIIFWFWSYNLLLLPMVAILILLGSLVLAENKIITNKYIMAIIIQGTLITTIIGIIMLSLSNNLSNTGV
jgi:hypothetical protein